MVRECAAALALSLAALASGCSLILDFSGESKPPIDAPFTMAECEFKEPNETAATASALALTDVGPAAICPMGGTEDLDFYKITLPANSTVAFKITFVNSTTGDLDLRILDAQGTQLSASRGFDNDEEITCPAASPLCPSLAAGDYLLEVLGSNPSMANRYDITISVTP